MNRKKTLFVGLAVAVVAVVAGFAASSFFGDSLQGACAATGCHGCSFASRGPVACTMEWTAAYACDKFIACGVVSGDCVKVQSPAYDACIACIQKCDITDSACQQKC